MALVKNSSIHAICTLCVCACVRVCVCVGVRVREPVRED